MQFSVVKFKEILDSPILRLEAEYWNSKGSQALKLIGSEIIDFVQYGTSKGLNEDRKGYPILR